MSSFSGVRLGALFLLFAPVFAFAEELGFNPNGPSLLQTPYKTEQEWIISSVCRNIFEILSYEADKKGEAVSAEQVTLTKVTDIPLVYNVVVHGAHATIEAKLQWSTESIWSGAPYQPFCKAVAQSLKLGPPESPEPQGNPLHTLLDFSESTIEAENQRISQWLTSHPGNAAAHEQAALLDGMLGMKEVSGFFYDPREACNHVCVHLAVAQFLRAGASPTSVEGRLAACLVGIKADMKTDTSSALDQLSKEKNAPTDLPSWLNAARLCNTSDYRLLKNPELASPFEQFAYVLALANSISIDYAVTWLQTHALPDRPDWGRLVLSNRFSVEAGHIYARGAVDRELHLMQATFPGKFQGNHLVDDLNQSSADVLAANGPEGGKLTVISGGMWAQFFQRHLGHAIVETGHFLADKWSVPEYPQKFDQDVSKNYSALSLYPNLQFWNWTVRHTPVDGKALLDLAMRHPEWVIYNLKKTKISSDPAATRLQQIAFQWFIPPFPYDTAYDLSVRLDGWGMSRDYVHWFYTVAPVNANAAEAEFATTTHDHATFAQYQHVMGPLLDYNTRVMMAVRHVVGVPYDQQFQLEQKAASIDPEQYWLLAYDCVHTGHEKDAAEAYQNYFDKGTDRVSVSNNMKWLVNYYYDHDQKEKAMAIATECSGTGSSLGMETLLLLLERMGRLDDAEQLGRQIEERYNALGALSTFYKRQADKGSAAYQAKFDELASKRFPQGLKKVELASLAGPPTAGITFSRTSEIMAQNGIAADQVVVALDGYGIQNKDQFIFVWHLSDSPNMKLIVWDGHAYREKTPNLPDRIFDAMYVNYPR